MLTTVLMPYYSLSSALVAFATTSEASGIKYITQSSVTFSPTFYACSVAIIV